MGDRDNKESYLKAFKEVRDSTPRIRILVDYCAYDADAIETALWCLKESDIQIGCYVYISTGRIRSSNVI